MTTLSCIEARSLVSDYIDGELPAGRASDLEHHLETCPFCPALYACLVQTLAELKELGDSRGVEDLAGRVIAALDDPQFGDPPRGERP